MSFVNIVPELMSSAGTDLANIATTISEATESAALPTTSIAAAGADEVSTGIAALFSAHGQAFQDLSAQAASFHQQFVELLHGGAAQYLNTEVETPSKLRSRSSTRPLKLCWVGR
jgi:PE family